MEKKASNYLPIYLPICLPISTILFSWASVSISVVTSVAPLLGTFVASTACAAPANDPELTEAIQKKDWPSVVLLLQPKKGQNFEHDLILAKALLSLERRQEAQKLLTSLQDFRKDERVTKLLQTAGSIFFNQETSNLYYESLEMIRGLKFTEAKEHLEQALAKEPFQVLLLTRLIQVELVLQQKDAASTNLKLAQSVTSGVLEFKLFAAKLVTDAQIAQTIAQEAVLASASPAPPEEDIDLELYQELSALKGPLTENEVTIPFWFEALKKAQKRGEIEALTQKILKEHASWTYALIWIYQYPLLNADLKIKVRAQIEKSLKNRDAFNQALALEMKKSDDLWLGYINFENLVAQWAALQPKPTPTPINVK